MARSLAVWVGIPILIALLSYCLASPSIKSWAGKVTGAPVVEYPRAVDLGEQEAGRVAAAPVTIANRGRSELLVDGMASSCSCSGLERDEGGSFVPTCELRLAPGEEMRLRVRVSVNGAPGDSFRSSLSFHTNDPDNPEGRIEVAVRRVTGGLLTTPRTAVFGTVLVGQEARQLVEVRDRNPTRRRVESVSSSDPERFSVQWSPVGEGDAEGTSPGDGRLLGRLEVSLLTRSPGPVDGTVNLDLPGRQTTTVSVVGRVAPLVELSPARLVLPRASDAGEVWSGTCLCRSNEHLPLALAAGASDEGLTIRITAVDGNPHLQKVCVEWDRSGRGMLASADLRTVRLKARVGSREFPVEFPVECLRKEGS
jgi:hypothetical protein